MDPRIRGSLLRGNGSRTGEGRKGPGKVLLIGGGAAILFALGVAGVTGPWSNPVTTFASEERDRPRGSVTIEAEQLHKAYRDDPREAAERYDNREMVVSGEFLRIVPDGYGSLDLRLKTSDPQDELGIDVAQLAIEDAKRLVPGQRVTLSCQRMGSGADEIWVQDCAIQRVGDVAPPASETSPNAPEQPQ
jgi:hypothetical protein